MIRHTIAIITARGGSKRIPRKNIRDFCGQPIIKYSIDAAIASGLFEEVMVSTDDAEIAETAKNFGASVPFMRSADTSSDQATTADVLKEVLLEYKKRGRNFDICCCIYPTAPFITVQKLEEAVKLLVESCADSLIPVVQFSFPPQRGLVIQNGNAIWVQPENRNTRSQDLEPIYHDCGQFYCFKVASFMTRNELIMSKTVAFSVPELEVQDIDNESDWEMAELKYTLVTKRGKMNDVI